MKKAEPYCAWSHKDIGLRYWVLATRKQNIKWGSITHKISTDQWTTILSSVRIIYLIMVRLWLSLEGEKRVFQFLRKCIYWKDHFGFSFKMELRSIKVKVHLRVYCTDPRKRWFFFVFKLHWEWNSGPLYWAVSLAFYFYIFLFWTRDLLSH